MTRASRTALVTGAGGQDGSYLVERLLADGWAVHGLVQDASTAVAVAPGVVLHAGDLRDGAGLRRLLDEVAPDHLYNLAGISSVARSWAQPELTVEVTGTAVATLLEAAWRLQESSGRQVRFLQATSAEIFGEPADSPQSEETKLRPVNPYGAAKAFAHHLVGVYRGRGLHALSCVLYNHESPRRPDTFVSRKITKTVAEISLGKADRLVLGNLDSRRDWGWAPDVVDAMVRALEHPEAHDYVIATGVAHSVRDFVTAAFEHVGIADWQRYVRVDPAFVRPVEATTLVGDPARARQELGWAPTVGFTEMVHRMVEEDVRLLRGARTAERQA